MPNKSVAVIIPTYNRANFIWKCVRSVLAQDYDGEISITVVDDCSTDNTHADLLSMRATYTNVDFIRNSKNRGHAYCRNIGAMPTHCDYILFLDDDNVLAPDAIGKLVAFCENKRDAGLVAPLAVNVDVCNGETKMTNWTLGIRFRPYLSTCQQMPGSTHHANETEHAPNGYMIDRKLFHHSGGFDADFRIYEDADLSFRLRKHHGKKTYILPSAKTYHYHGLGKTASELRKYGIESARRAFWMNYFRCVFWKRHYPFFNWLFVVAFSCPAASAYYFAKALRHGRIDIAAASVSGWIFGAARSIFSNCKKEN